MCLTTNDCNLMVAHQDIYVYKTLARSKVDRPWWKRMLGINKYQAVSSGTGYLYQIGKQNPIVCLKPLSMFTSPIEYEVEEGYHSDVERQKESNALFMIPKGTRYIKGWFNLDKDRKNYVSETIVFVRHLRKRKNS